MGFEHNRGEIATEALNDRNPESWEEPQCLSEPEFQFAFCWSIWKLAIG